MIKKLRNKIALINLGMVSIILFSALIAVFAVGFSRQNEANQVLTDNALTFVDNTRDTFAYGEKDEFFSISVVLFQSGSEPEVFVHKNNPQNAESLKATASEILNLQQKSGFSLRTLNIFSVKHFEDGCVAVALLDTFGQNVGIGRYAIVAVITLLLSLLCFFLISFLLANLALKPVEESWTKQKQFVADASHELKTPLSVIMANTEIIASNPDETVKSQIKWIENTKIETQKMAELVASLLFLAKNDDGLIVQMEEVNLSDCAGKTALSYDAIFYENGKQFDHNIELNAFVCGNKQQLLQLTTILLDNANKYSMGIGNILLTLKTASKNVILSVSNDSVTMTDEQMKHVFDRFFTTEQSRNKSSGGSGLGLAIAKVIAETHKGKIAVSSQNNRTTFSVTFPKRKD